MHPVLQLDNRQVFTVSEVTRDIRGLLEDNFPAVWVTGQISNFKPSAAGHFYFNLKDEKSCISAVMFRGMNLRVKFEPQDGLEVIIHGRLSVYEPRGAYQIIADYMEPKGLGALQLAFEQLKARLNKEGLFDQAAKKPLPFLPKKVGIITSAHGAALHDMLTIIRRRNPRVDICIHPVKVQGDGASVEIAAAIGAMNERDDIDVLIVGRGGGAIEDLWAFNEELVVRSVFGSRLPVISAVGHETDFTLCDLAADLRAPTPSAAAELAVPVLADLSAAVQQISSRLSRAMTNGLGERRETISSLKKRLKSPQRVLNDFKLKIDDLETRLSYSVQNRLRQERQSLRQAILSLPYMAARLQFLRLKTKGLMGKISLLSPMASLERGYGIIFNEKTGRVVKSVSEVAAGDRVFLRLKDGMVKAEVKE